MLPYLARIAVSTPGHAYNTTAATQIRTASLTIQSLRRAPTIRSHTTRMRRVVGVTLMVDGVLAIYGFTLLLASLGSRDEASVAVIVARALAAGLTTIGGWLVTQRRPPGDALAVAGAVATAVVVTTGMVGGLLPTNLSPDFRLPVSLAYCGAAVAVIAFVRWGKRM